MRDKTAEFIAEAEELLDEASSSVLEIQELLPSTDPDKINNVFRAMHTLKGMAGLFGFSGLSDVSHELEDILDMVRLGKTEINSNVTGFLFSSFDSIKKILKEIRRGKQDGDLVSSTLTDVRKFSANLLSGDSSEGEIHFPAKHRGLLSVLSEYEEHRLRIGIKEGKSVYLIKTNFTIAEFDVLLKEMVDRLKSVGEVISTLPTSEGVEDGSIGFQVMVTSLSDAGDIESAGGYAPELLLSDKNVPALQVPAEAEDGQTIKSTSSSIRVDISRVDSILDTIAELSLSRQAIFNIWQSFVQEHGNTSLAIDLYRVSQTMQRRFELLQSQVLEIRMIPIGQIFSRLSQVVRRYSSGAGKRIRLELYGDDTEIDKHVAEEVVDPLMHAVRNSIDHGIESGEDRVSQGKGEEGVIELRALQKGNNVIISIKDDGRGIDPDRVRAKAMEKGLVGVDEMLETRDILDLIFSPGFSTAEAVSETSGRGVGLDVVKERMASLGGAIEVQSEPGMGTSFIFTLPITLSLIRALIVSVEDELFAVPLTSMSETFIAERHEIQEVEGSLVYNLRGEMLPLASMRELLRYGENGKERYFVVVVGHGDRRMGLMLDEFKGQQEIVIKPLGGYFDGVRGYAGASEIGRYKVVLVLDVETLISDALSRRKIPSR